MVNLSMASFRGDKFKVSQRELFDSSVTKPDRFMFKTLDCFPLSTGDASKVLIMFDEIALVEQ